MQLKDGRVVPAFIDQVLNGEANDDLRRRFANTKLLLCFRPRARPGICSPGRAERYPVNLGNPREMTILEFADCIQRTAGLTAPIEHRSLPQDDPKRRQPDIAKAREILGWEPEIALEDGIRETLEYFRVKLARTATPTL